MMSTARPTPQPPADLALGVLLALVARITRETRHPRNGMVLVDRQDIIALGAAWRKYQTILSAAPEPGAEDES